MANNVHDFKVVLVGEGCVGKTSLILRYIENTFNSNHITTVQASFLKKKLNIDGQRVNLAIWDTAGQEQFHALGPLYYRNSNGAVLVYDITDASSFPKVKVWVKELRKMLGNDVCLVIVGNKTDLEKERHVSLEEAEQYSEAVGAIHFQTSAKLDEGVEDVFLGLTNKMLEQAAKQHSRNETLERQGSQRRNVIIVDDEDTPPPASTRQCCSHF
ncbi:ADP ribosylation factor [Oryctes borbonicus]|uniref:Ras-related protein Rab-21 n=1 Tax=Oryctes borbonicus TaxID=1629725 RepID=A0A0T6BBL2_9SCAR|nr:ADP ribosylation factor [Oryctes borbonicus]